MAKVLKYKFDKVHLKRSTYVPKGHADIKFEQNFGYSGEVGQSFHCDSGHSSMGCGMWDVGWGQTCLLQFAEFWGLELCFTYARSSMDERQPRMIRWDGKTWALMISERNKEN